MFTPLILFLGLTVATAVIAYWSDNLGKKLGKKRVSLLGMRPRTTATFLTITSSWAIMVFTLGALLAVVTPLRHALFRYDQERAQYRRDRETFQRDRVAAQEQIRVANAQLSGTRQQLSQTQTNLQTQQQRTQKAQQARARAEAGRQTAQGYLSTAQRSLASAKRGETSALQGARRALQSEKDAQRSEEEAQRLANAARRDLGFSRVQLNRNRLQLSAARNQLGRIRTQLGAARTNLAAARTNLVRVRAALGRTSAAAFRASRSAFAAASQVLKLETRQRQLQQDIENAATGAALFAQSEATVRVGQTFAARLVPAHQSVARIEAQLGEILSEGQSAFRQSDETRALAASGARLQLAPLDEQIGKNAVRLQGRALIERLARDIAAQNGPTSIRLVAARNFVPGEKEIAARFVAVPVAVAFREGETLASLTVDGSAGDAGIFHQLLNLIEIGRKEAEKRGVNPPQPVNEANFFAEGTNVALFAALRRIEASKRPQRVTLVAGEELSTVEPLKVRFEVEGATSS